MRGDLKRISSSPARIKIGRANPAGQANSPGQAPLLLLLDVGNTHTHLGLADEKGIVRSLHFPTSRWRPAPAASKWIRARLPPGPWNGAAVASVVPATSSAIAHFLNSQGIRRVLHLGHRTVRGLGIRYPAPERIGADRLANAVAARHWFGAPAIVIDAGTAVTFDVINGRGEYAGGVIAPGLNLMTEYLYEKTALLPRVQLRKISRVIGKSTEEAILSGAVHGYRGLVMEVLAGIKHELRAATVAIIATGGAATFLASEIPGLTAVEPLLTLEGLRLNWNAWQKLPRSRKSNEGTGR